MTFALRFLASLLLATLVSGGSLRAEKPTPTPSPTPTPEKAEKSGKKNKEKDKEKSNDPASTSGEMDIPVPPGVPVKGIKVPHYGPDGRLIMVFDADVATKVDDTNVQMENLKIEAYGDDGKKFNIELPQSVFNLETRILTGSQKVLIRREDFEITGDAGEFHTKTRFAKVLGNVKMTIFSTENFNQ